MDNDETDDEGSGEIVADRGTRSRRMSTQSNFEGKPIEPGFVTASQTRRFTRRNSREKRSGSVARSLHEFPVSQKVPGKGTKSMTSDSVFSSEIDSDQPFKENLIPKVAPLAQEEDETFDLRKGVENIGKIASTFAPKSTTSTAVGAREPPTKFEPKILTHPGPSISGMRSWTCEHCTYINDASVKICAVCCKTPNIKAQPWSPTLDNVNEIYGQDESQLKGTKPKKISFDTGTKC